MSSSESHALEVADAVLFKRGYQGLLFKVIQVGDGFAHSELALVRIIDFPVKQRRHDAAGRLRLFAQ